MRRNQGRPKRPLSRMRLARSRSSYRFWYHLNLLKLLKFFLDEFRIFFSQLGYCNFRIFTISIRNLYKFQ